MRFIAMASVVCASREIEPNDIAPVEKRLTIVVGRFDLLERHGLAAVLLGRLDAEQAADRQQLLALLVEQLGDRRRTCPWRCRAPRAAAATPFAASRMRLAADAVGVFAADLERVAQHRRVAEGIGVAPHRLLGDLVEARAFDRRRGAEEDTRR